MPGRNGGTLRRGNPGNIGGMGQEGLHIRAKRRAIVELAMQEMHRRLLEQPMNPDFAELTSAVVKFDDELRVNKSEVSVRDPLTIVLKRE